MKKRICVRPDKVESTLMAYVLILMTLTAASGTWITQQIPYPDRNSCEAMAEMVNAVKPTQAKMQKARCVSQGHSGSQDRPRSG